MSALTCAPPFNSFFHIRLHRTLLSFISFLFSFISFPVVLSSQISSLFFSFHFFISLSKQISGYLYSFTVCFPRGLASFLPFSFPNLLFFHMFSPAFPFSTIRGGNLIVIICQWNFFKKKIRFQAVLVRPLVPWTRISSVYWHVIVTLPSRPLTLLEQRIQANWK